MNQATVTKPKETQLPDPDQLEEADVVIYDGHCKFCTQQVQRIHRFDGRNRLAFISLHDPRVTERYPSLTHDQLMEEMCVCTGDGRQYFGADAFRYLTRRLPKLWFIVPVMHIPCSLPLWKYLYRQIAKRRYQLMGKTGECENGTCSIHFD